MRAETHPRNGRNVNEHQRYGKQLAKH
jgi:hypothetical protein